LGVILLGTSMIRTSSALNISDFTAVGTEVVGTKSLTGER